MRFGVEAIDLADQAAQADRAADELVEWHCLDRASQEWRHEAWDFAPAFGVAHCGKHAGSYRHLDRVPVPARRRITRAGAQRQYELLAAGAEAAGGSVEAVEDDPLDRGIKAAAS